MLWRNGKIVPFNDLRKLSALIAEFGKHHEFVSAKELLMHRQYYFLELMINQQQVVSLISN